MRTPSGGVPTSLAQRPTVSAEGLLPEPWLDFAAKQIRPRDIPGMERIRGIRRLACDLGEGWGETRR